MKIHSVITVGIFDGVHRGHQKILKKVVSDARRKHWKSIVITFDPHPQKVLRPEAKIPLLMSLKHRINLIKEIGIDECHVLKFTKLFAKKSPEDFIKTLVEKCGFKKLVMGEDFLFGFQGGGDRKLLKKLARLYDFQVSTLVPLKLKGKVVSSTRIRQSIERGNLIGAQKMLRRPVSILGTVVHGKKVGRKLGFPTANIDPHHEAIPPSGVYAVDARIEKRTYKGIVNIGRRPTFFKDKEPTIELHIFHFRKDIYGKDVEIMFKKRIRSERTFPSFEALQAQISRDIQLAL